MPIFIASPIQRCGTTLLQRLLSSAPNTLVFGESVANDIHVFVSLLQSKELMLNGPHNAWRNQQLERVLAGEVNEWIPDLLPDTAAYLENFKQQLVQYCTFLQTYTRQKGREQWGCKMPGWPVMQLGALMRLLPEAKVLYIDRPLEECIISSRTINMCLDEPGTQQFRQFYTFNRTNAEQQLPANRTLWIDYHELCEKTNEVLQKIEVFTGAHSIDRDVMAHKVGNYQQAG